MTIGGVVSSVVHRNAERAMPPQVVPYCDLKAHCNSCCLHELCLTTGLELEPTHLLDGIVSNRARVKRRDSLYRTGDPFNAVYAIRLGTFKTLVLAEDGREQITGCYMGGDIVGLDGIGDGRHTCGAVALEDSEVCVLPFEELDNLARSVPALGRNLYRCISRDLSRGQEMMFLLGSMRAEQRLAVFLLNLARRYQARGYSSSEFLLRMTREEIASFLGLKLETISRLFSRLQAEGLIQVQGRTIKLLDPGALKEMVGRETSLSPLTYIKGNRPAPP
jgi:CRP/FNR family transcriptional regulator